jgi:hypothetical protein
MRKPFQMVALRLMIESATSLFRIQPIHLPNPTIQTQNLPNRRPNGTNALYSATFAFQNIKNEPNNPEQMNQIYKYPRTLHIRGSRLQAGDEDLADVPLESLKGKHLVIEEKFDGANCAISFGYHGLQLQSRGHYLSGGPRERQFDLLKTWAHTYAQDFQAVLGERYVMYGEWLYAKHTVFYNALRHYFLEFDILDLETMSFLDTPRRHALLQALPMVQSMPVVYSGPTPTMKQLLALIGESEAIVGDPVADLRRVAASIGKRADQVVAETAADKIMEGLYLKVEENGIVTARYKYVRAGFMQALIASDSHWMDRPILPNQLKPGIDIFAG